MKSFNPGSGRGVMSPELSEYIEDVVLPVDTLVRIPIPTGARHAIFSFNGDFRVKMGAAGDSFALPTATSSNGRGSSLNPNARRIPETATHILLRSPYSCIGAIEFYSA